MWTRLSTPASLDRDVQRKAEVVVVVSSLLDCWLGIYVTMAIDVVLLFFGMRSSAHGSFASM